MLCVYGGGSKWEQSNAVKEGCDILVATPGRLIDLVKLKAFNLLSVTFLVFDEADRMFDLGFGELIGWVGLNMRVGLNGREELKALSRAKWGGWS